MKREDAPEAICVFDVESTGISIEDDRILTCYAMVQDIKGEILREAHWTIDPGVEVPQGASDVHGMTTEWIRENGRKDADRAVREIAGFLDESSMAGYPIVGYNNAYDLGILDRELVRYGAVGLDVGLSGATGYFDPLIYDRANDKYRKGGRKLMDVARHYGIEIDDSRLHEAEYDVIVTAKLAWIIMQRSPWTIAELQPLQREWKADWARHLTEYFASQGKTEDGGAPILVDGSFPWRGRAERVEKPFTRLTAKGA